MSSRGNRHVERTAVKHALRKETRRRDVIREMKSRPRKIDTRSPPPPPSWDLGPTPTMAAVRAHTRALKVFAGHAAELDAVLGWLFARFPAFGAAGSDMVAHHILLSSDAYYGRWVEFCRALNLFPRDP